MTREQVDELCIRVSKTRRAKDIATLLRLVRNARYRDDMGTVDYSGRTPRVITRPVLIIDLDRSE